MPSHSNAVIHRDYLKRSVNSKAVTAFAISGCFSHKSTKRRKLPKQQQEDTEKNFLAQRFIYQKKLLPEGMQEARRSLSTLYSSLSSPQEALRFLDYFSCSENPESRVVIINQSSYSAPHHSSFVYSINLSGFEFSRMQTPGSKVPPGWDTVSKVF